MNPFSSNPANRRPFDIKGFILHFVLLCFLVSPGIAEMLETHTISPEKSIHSIQLSADGNTLLYATDSDSGIIDIHLFNREDETFSTLARSVNSPMAMSLDARFVAYRSADGEHVLLLDRQTGTTEVLRGKLAENLYFSLLRRDGPFISDSDEVMYKVSQSEHAGEVEWLKYNLRTKAYSAIPLEDSGVDSPIVPARDGAIALIFTFTGANQSVIGGFLRGCYTFKSEPFAASTLGFCEGRNVLGKFSLPYEATRAVTYRKIRAKRKRAQALRFCVEGTRKCFFLSRKADFWTADFTANDRGMAYDTDQSKVVFMTSVGRLSKRSALRGRRGSKRWRFVWMFDLSTGDLTKIARIATRELPTRPIISGNGTTVAYITKSDNRVWIHQTAASD